MADLQELYKRFIAGGEKHPNYKITKELAEKIKIHADGQIPDKLIDERRPNESQFIKDYRKKIYAAITKNPINKVITSLGKIRRSTDWNIRYDKDKLPRAVADYSLEKYMEFDYPVFASLTNWVFSELLKQYLIDANGVYACIPQKMETQRNEFISPVAYFFPSEQVVAFEPEEYCVLLSSDTNRYTSPQGRNVYQDGLIYYIITDERIVKYVQSSKGKDFNVEYDFEHNLGYMPADKAGGLFVKRSQNDTVYESRINVMTVHLDEAAREYSDLQAEVVQHIHSEKYSYATDECPTCKGNGVAKAPDGAFCECGNCKGSGRITSNNVYGMHVINMQKKLEDYQMPTPPIGYIVKDVEIVRIQAERIKNHIFSALAAINMEFLAESPINQSGVAKEVDRDELNNFVNGIAEDIVRIMDNIYKWICDLRYDIAVPDKEKRRAMLPTISVPERYDLLSATHLMNEITSLKQANANPLVISALEVDYIRKKFNADPEASDRLQAVLTLDPLQGLTTDDKMTYFADGVIREIDFIVSANIVRFVSKALADSKDFISMSLDEKIALLESYAQEIIDSKPKIEPRNAEYSEGS